MENTATQTHETPTDLAHQRLTAYLDALREQGYTRSRVDTLTNGPVGFASRGATGTVQVRHHYSGGDFTLTVLDDNQVRTVYRYTIDKPLPTVEQILAATVGT